MMSKVDAAWVAGITEGEGCFRFHLQGNRKNSWAFKVTVAMTDEDVIRRLHSITKLGNVHGPYTRKNKPLYKPEWRWTVQSNAEAMALCASIRDFMGKRRGARIDEMLEKWRSLPPPSYAANSLKQYEGVSPLLISLDRFDRPRRPPASGVRGVVWHRKSDKWQARGNFRGIGYHLGLFENLKDAENAVLKFKEDRRNEYLVFDGQTDTPSTIMG